ncbi:hypothetical protein HAX54_011828 [Datura stramonium]|uniref:Uncharacterized protein n=1 Tax=Datura stramonium TaxID=4076 RepID=A0ABS8Y0Q9_DATST|nr:hypothetical protein [Datura stramonium]
MERERSLGDAWWSVRPLEKAAQWLFRARLWHFPVELEGKATEGNREMRLSDLRDAAAGSGGLLVGARVTAGAVCGGFYGGVRPEEGVQRLVVVAATVVADSGEKRERRSSCGGGGRCGAIVHGGSVVAERGGEGWGEESGDAVATGG